MFLLLFLLVAVLPVSTEGGEIIGGKKAERHSWPYMALINFYREGPNPHRCGGFLVKEDIVMTAAHCKGRNMTVTLGVHKIKKRNRPNPIRVVKCMDHKKYDKKKHVNDIMLLKLEKKVQLGGDVNTINLTNSNDPVKPGNICSVAGWGKLENCHLSNTLMEVELQVQEGKICQSMYKNYNDTSQLCVGNPKKMKATAGGDSGGPLVCNGKAHGIVSYHCSIIIPSRVYTRISAFLPWIKKKMKTLENP